MGYVAECVNVTSKLGLHLLKPNQHIILKEDVFLYGLVGLRPVFSHQTSNNALQHKLGQCDLDRSCLSKPNQFIRHSPNVCLWSLVEFGQMDLLVEFGLTVFLDSC